MSDADAEHFRQLVRARSGLVLTPEKAYLIASRLAPIAREQGLAGTPALLAKLRAGAPEALVKRCVEAMCTHESFFFRDGTPFDLLARQVLPALSEARRGARTLRIWCAACSSGQEPYSVAIAVQESGLFAGWRVEIVATDVSDAILKKAKSGLYSEFEVKRGLTEARLKRWFAKDGQVWRVDPELQRLVTFRPHNLLNGVGGMGVFDVIFCRNVLIYFDVNQKRAILGELSKAIAADGALFLGSAETVFGVTTAFELTPRAAGLFRPTAGKPAASGAELKPPRLA